MSAEGKPPDPGEDRLVGYLEELRGDAPAADPSLTSRVQKSARWQAAIRGPLELVGHLGGALVDGIAALLGVSRRRRQ
jgi:hypothetical protein